MLSLRRATLLLVFLGVTACSGKVNLDGHNTADAGAFPCGETVQCRAGAELCQRKIFVDATKSDVFTCEPIPESCGPDVSCGCLVGLSCSNLCTMDKEANVTVTCPGG
jgi:hypothetical protein